MTSPSELACRSRVARGATRLLALLLLALLLAGTSPSVSAANPPQPLVTPVSAVAAAAPCAGFMDYVIGNRTRLIQICTLGVLLGLFILMRK